jgi:hypothetical protein
LTSAAYANGKYVAVGGGSIISSPDGVTWSPVTAGPGGAGVVAGSSIGFVAVSGATSTFPIHGGIIQSGGPQCYFSQNGLTWTTNVLAYPGSGSPLTAGYVGFAKGKFLVAAYSSPGPNAVDLFVFTSSDGQNWTSNSVATGMPDEGGGLDYTCFMSGPNVVLSGEIEVPFVLSSPDEVSWSFQESRPNPNFQGYAGAYGNGVYVIVRNIGTIYTSADSTNWTLQSFSFFPADVGPTYTCRSITSSNGVYVVATDSGVVSSTNGSVYAAESGNNLALLSAVTYSNSFVGVGYSGLIYQSSNGVAWAQRNSGTANDLNSVAAGNGLLVAVGNNGAVQTSPSGLIWTSRLSGTSLSLYGVTYSNGLYVAVGQEGTVVTSPDGINWAVQYSGQLNNLLSVTYGSAGFLAVGTNGTILTSPDGTNWTQQISGTSAGFQSATFGNGYYLVTGTNAVVMTSPDGSNWTSRYIGAVNGPTLYGSAFLNGRFDVVGAGGTILESDPFLVLDLRMHAAPNQNVFTLFATPGSNFRLVSSSNLVGGPWSTVATFNNAAAITLWTNNVAGGSPTFFRLVSP